MTENKDSDELYKKYFNRRALRKIYEEKIAESSAIGRDGIRQETFKKNFKSEINLILKKVGNKSYKFTPYKQKLILKGARKFPREISIPTIRDRLTLRALNEILVESFKEAVTSRPHAYISKISEELNKPSNELEKLSFVRLDIKDFYPTINQTILVRKVRARIKEPSLIYLLREALKTPTSSADNYDAGVPQGLSISNILSSIYLGKIDQKFQKQRRIKYFRYVDDVLVICAERVAKKIFSTIQKELKKLKLECHDLEESSKSKIVSVPNGIEYLGFSLKPPKISVRKMSYRKMFDGILTVFTGHKYLHQENEDQLVWRLNTKITGCIFKNNRFGWLFFFSQINDISQLARLDKFVKNQLDKRGLSKLKPRIKRFVKSYYEIRYNLRDTSYIPKYDTLDTKGMVRELSQAEGKSVLYFQKLSDDEIKDRFFRLIERQARLLEKDLVAAFS